MTPRAPELWSPAAARVRSPGPSAGEWALIGLTVGTLVLAGLL